MKISKSGQITIPKELRDKYGLHKGVDVDFIDDGTGLRVVKRGDGASRVDSIRGVIKLKHARSVDEYIEEIRG